MRINDNHWRQVQDDKNKINMACTLQCHLPGLPKTKIYCNDPVEQPKVLETALSSQQRAWNTPFPT